MSDEAMLGTNPVRFARWVCRNGPLSLCFTSSLPSAVGETAWVYADRRPYYVWEQLCISVHGVIIPRLSQLFSILYVSLSIEFLSWLVSFFHHINIFVWFSPKNAPCWFCLLSASMSPSFLQAAGARITLCMCLSWASTTNCSDLILFLSVLFWNPWLQPWFFIFLSAADSTVPGI